MRIPVISSVIQRLRVPRFPGFARRRWKTLYMPTIAFFLALLMTLGQGLIVLAAVLPGQIQSYTPGIRQATINLGAADGVGKYDRGQIELVSQDNPNSRFIAANIVVLQVKQNSAVVEVREKEGLQVNIGPGALIFLETRSGQARLAEESRLAQQSQTLQAAVGSQQQQLEQARRQRQWEQAQATRVHRELQLEQARAQAATQQRDFELAQAERQQIEQAQQQQAQQQQDIQAQIAAEQQMQRELEVAINAEVGRQQALQVAIAETEQAQRQLEIAQAEEARIQQELEAQQVALQPSQPPALLVGNIRKLWKQPAEASIAVGGPNADLPQDYLQAYRQARSNPSPENYYAFAQVLIDYELPNKALMWLDEAETAFPQTKSINDAYEAIALTDIGMPYQAMTLLEASGLPDQHISDEIRSYILTSMGEWDQVAALSKSTPSAVTQNNLMIAQYCQHPPEIDRRTELPPMSCSVLGRDVQAEPSEDGLETIQAFSQDVSRQYSRDPYVLNTLGFLSLQIEDYEGAHRYYKELAQLLDRSNTTSPQLLEVKASAINYLNNYNQNYDFLTEQSQDLALLRAEYGQAMGISALRGVGSVVAGATGAASTPNMVIGAIRAIDGFFRARTQRRHIRHEQTALLDQMSGTFRQDMRYVPARPSLEPRQLLQATRRQSWRQAFHWGMATT